MPFAGLSPRRPVTCSVSLWMQPAARVSVNVRGRRVLGRDRLGAALHHAIAPDLTAGAKLAALFKLFHPEHSNSALEKENVGFGSSSIERDNKRAMTISRRQRFIGNAVEALTAEISRAALTE